MTQAGQFDLEMDDVATWEVLLGTPGTRPIHSMAQGPDGRWYLTDELNHRLMIVEHDGTRRLIGGPGYDAGQFLHPRGLTLFTDPATQETRVYVCDAGNHRIQVLTLDGVPLGAFGGFGSGPGQFNAPTAIAVAFPEFGDPDIEGEETAADPLLVVADQRNNRLQVFEPDGSHVATIGAAAPKPGRALSRAGWPEFRLGAHPFLFEPSHLSWDDGEIQVTSSEGSLTRIDLAVAMLPDYETWRLEAEKREPPVAHLLPFRRGRLFGAADGTAVRILPGGAQARDLPASVERLLCRI
jgi:hypothetical protein